MERKQTLLITVFFLTSILCFSQKVIKKDGVYVIEASNEKYSGTYISYHDNGEKEGVYTLKDGLENGKAEFYYSTGEIMEQGSFKKGQKDGRWIRWGQDGSKLAEAYYNEGKKDGKWLIWDELGTKRYEMYYKKGKKIGEWIMWDEKGQIANKKNWGSN